MLIVAERINASRKAIHEALAARDADFIRQEARAQAEAGADFIDVNAGTFPGQETELLPWLVDVVQEVTDAPLCLDSPDPEALAAAIRKVTGSRTLINSITLEGDRFDKVLSLAMEHNAKLIALCQSEEKIAKTAEEKADFASQLIDRLTGAGMALDDIYVDPLVFPVATDSDSGQATLGAIRQIMERFPGVHTICGLTNVSHGLPARKLINRAFLIAAIAMGLDAAIVDPTDVLLMSSLTAAEALVGRDEYCMNYITAFRAGKLE